MIANRFIINDPTRDLLGRGGMGEVYRATDTQTGELVAVKALNPEVVTHTPDLVERFVREGEALRQLNHPNIVRMIAAVQEQGRHYLVVEYVSGGSLADVLAAQGRLPSSRVIELALDLADALTRAHRLGIIHRDLKPANVLLAQDGTPRLADFGIAHVESDQHLTQTGVLMGTVDYLSPEVCQGKPPDERADIWAFGVMLFEMLSGRLPFEGTSLTARLTAILTQPIPDLAQFAPDVPDALADLVYRMLEKDRQQRIPSVRLVGAELEAILKGREVPTPARLAPGETRFATPTPPADAPRHNLPVQPTPFVGREAELTELARLLADPTVHLLTILGVGGMGKTRLALEAGAAQLDNFEHGVYFVSLAPLQSVEAIVPTVAEALDFSFYEGVEPRQQLLDYLRQKAMLLIMDNFEHLLDGVGLVTDALKTAPGVKVLSTSRARLNVQGEHLFHLAGMDFPDWETPQDATQYSAVKLFLQSARRARSGFKLAADDLKYVARICRLVGGMPLGILLAAAWVGVLAPAEIAAEIGQSLDFLETDLRDVPERQRSMRAMFDHSWNLLTGREWEVFRGLSVFRGGFTRQAAQQVTGASLRDLMTLVDKSLLQRDPAGRYGIHELLRQYAAEKLGQAPAEERTIRDRQCAYYAEFLRQRETLLIGRRQKQALTEIGIEIENVRTSWDWAVTQGRTEDINCSLESLAEFYWIRAWFQEGEQTFARAAERLDEEQRDATDRKTRFIHGKVLLQQGRFCDPLGLVDKGCRQVQQSLAIFRDLGARKEMAYALCYLGELGPSAGDKELYQEGLTIFKEIGDQRGIAYALVNLGSVAIYQAEYEEAKQLIQKSLDIVKELGDQPGIIASLRSLSYANFVIGEYEEARRLGQASFALSKEIGDQFGVAAALADLARAAAGLENYGESKRLCQDSLALCREIGWLGGIEVALGDLGEVANAIGEYAEAMRLDSEGLAIAQVTDKLNAKAWQLRVLGNAACGLKDYTEARSYFHKALEILVVVRLPSFALLTLVGIATLLAAGGEKERALELLALVIHHPLSWKWTKDRAAPLVAELEAELSPDVVAAAQERSQARDLDTTVSELLVELGG